MKICGTFSTREQIRMNIFAEAVFYWVLGSVPDSLVEEETTLAEYDPAAAALVTEVFNEVTLPASCDD